LQKETKNNIKRNELAKKGEEIFLAEAIFQEGTTFLQPDPCVEQPPGVPQTEWSSSKRSCWLLKMHICFKVLLTEVH